MNQRCGVDELKDACRRKDLNRTLEEYIESCRIYGKESDDGTSTRGTSKKGVGRFPNIAGFCRYYRIGVSDLYDISRQYPDEIEKLYAILEDEALNSGLPPAVLSAYLKKRLGYEKDIPRGDPEVGPLSIRFEHDIYEDGE